MVYLELTFERIEPVDDELEKAKELIGKWITVKDIHGIFEVVEVERIIASLILTTKDGRSHLIEYCTPFTIPVWRCCETDKPKFAGRYYTRRKLTHAERDLDEFCGENWEGINPEYIRASEYEWLDEGER